MISGMLKRLSILLLAGLLAAPAGRAEPRYRAIPIDSFAALVNARVITIGDVLEVFQPVEQQLRDTYSGRELDSKLEAAFTNALNALIDRALILEDFAKSGGNLPDRAVDDHINEIIHDRFNNNQAAFLDALAESRMTLADWRAEMKDRLVVMILRRKEVNDRIAITPNEIRAVYDGNLDKYRVPEQVKLRMIVIGKGVSANDERVKRREAEEIRERLLDGESFSVVAKEVSEGPKAAQGGDMGWLEPTALKTEIRAAIAGLAPGQISPVIESAEDFYLVQVEARKNASVQPFEQVRDEIETQLRNDEGSRLYDAWMARLRNKHFVRIFPIEPPSGRTP